MAVKRYWRLVGLSTPAGGDLELSELRLYEGGAAADDGATLTTTFAPISGSLGALTDGFVDAVVAWAYADYSTSGFAFTWDFGVGGGVSAPIVVLGSGSSADTYLRDLVAQHSSDGINWVTYLASGSVKYPGALSLSEADLSSDPLSASVTLLLTDSLTDKSSSPKTMTVTGGVAVSSAQLLGGKQTLYFNGAGDYVSTPSSGVDFEFGSGDFTVELFAWQSSRTAGEYDSLFQFDALAGTSKSMYVLFSAEFLGFLVSNGAGGWAIAKSISTSLLPSLNAWHHIAITRYGSTWTMWIDGVDIGSATYAGAMVKPSTSFQIGWSNTSDSYFHGYIGGFRITKGNARYTGAFTPPTSYGGDLLVDATISPTALFRTDNPRLQQYLSSTPLPASAAVSHLREYPFFDVYNGGVGIITGTVKEKNTPANTPLRRRVLLIDEASRMTIRETWSDQVTGAFEFRGIKHGVKYSVISYHGLRNGEIATELVAEPMVMP